MRRVHAGVSDLPLLIPDLKTFSKERALSQLQTRVQDMINVNKNEKIKCAKSQSSPK